MNDYRSYFNKIEVPGSLHRKLLAGQKPEKHAAPVWVKYGGMAACLALVFLAGWGFWRMMPPPMGGDITVGDSLIPGEKDTYGPGETPGVLATPTPVPTEKPYVPTLAFTDRNNDPEPVASIMLPKGHFELPIRDKSCLEVLGIESELLLDSYTITGEFICAGDGAIWRVNILGVSVEDAEKTFTIALAEDKLPLECIVYEDGTENKINGTSVQADYFAYDRDGDGKNEYISRTTFMNKDIGIRLEVVGRADTRMEAERLTLDILQGTGGRLSSVPPDEIPAWRSESLTLDKARAEEGFGTYIPAWVPEGFAFERAYREMGQNRDWLSTSWSSGYDYIDVMVYWAELYPQADSDNPPISAADLTDDLLIAQFEYVDNDAGDVAGYRGRFAVNYGDGFIVQYNFKGATPQEAVKMLDIPERSAADETLAWPIPGEYTISQPFGKRVHPLTGNITYSNGIGVQTGEGTFVVAVADGTVVESDYSETQGNYVKLEHGEVTFTLYGHVSGVDWKQGDTVKQGEVLGYVDQSGTSTGPHLYMEFQSDGEYLNPLEQYTALSEKFVSND